MGEALGEGTVVGEEDQAFAVVVEAADGVEAEVFRGADGSGPLDDGGAALGVMGGAEDAAGFVGKIGFAGFGADGTAVEGDGVAGGVDAEAGFGGGAAVDGDAAGGEEGGGAAAGRESGGGEEGLEAGGGVFAQRRTSGKVSMGSGPAMGEVSNDWKNSVRVFQ